MFSQSHGVTNGCYGKSLKNVFLFSFTANAIRESNSGSFIVTLLEKWSLREMLLESAAPSTTRGLVGQCPPHTRRSGYQLFILILANDIR